MATCSKSILLRFLVTPESAREPRGSASSGSTSNSRARTRTAQEPDSEDNQEENLQDNEDTIDLLEDAEALELVEFDPSVAPKNSWEAPKAITEFLNKHFNRALSEDEKEAIMKDFPKPDCNAMVVPKLDDEVKDQLKKKGKDPHFGAEKSMYKIQEHILDVAGPLTCLWADLLNKEAITPDQTLLLIQRALVLLGTASHYVSQERRKVAWSRINPNLKSLASEDYSKRESKLFGPEKASKKLEADKTLSKVSDKPGGPSRKRSRYENDRSDLRSFLAKGTPARYGGRKPQRHQPYSSYTRFQSSKYHQGWKNQQKPLSAGKGKEKDN